MSTVSTLDYTLSVWGERSYQSLTNSESESVVWASIDVNRRRSKYSKIKEATNYYFNCQLFVLLIILSWRKKKNSEKMLIKTLFCPKQHRSLQSYRTKKSSTCCKQESRPFPQQTLWPVIAGKAIIGKESCCNSAHNILLICRNIRGS